MKFEISDDKLMAVSAATWVGVGGWAALDPKGWQDTNFKLDTYSAPVNRLMGHCTVAAGAVMLATREDRMTAKGMKDMHKCMGAVWGSLGAHQAYLVSKKQFKTEPMPAAAMALTYGLAGLHLYKGFKKDKK